MTTKLGRRANKSGLNWPEGPIHQDQTGPKGQYIKTQLARRASTAGPNNTPNRNSNSKLGIQTLNQNSKSKIRNRDSKSKPKIQSGNRDLKSKLEFDVRKLEVEVFSIPSFNLELLVSISKFDFEFGFGVSKSKQTALNACTSGKINSKSKLEIDTQIDTRNRTS